MCQRRLIASMEGASICGSRGAWLLRGTLIMRPTSATIFFRTLLRDICSSKLYIATTMVYNPPGVAQMVAKIQGTIRGWYGHSGI